MLRETTKAEKWERGSLQRGNKRYPDLEQRSVRYEKYFVTYRLDIV